MSSLANAIDHMLSSWLNDPALKSLVPKRAWIESDEGKIYLRLTSRLIANDRQDTIDLATVEIDPDHEGQGVFRKCLEVIERHAAQNNRTVFVESVLSPILASTLARRHYQITNPHDDPSTPCFAKTFSSLSPNTPASDLFQSYLTQSKTIGAKP